MLIILVTKSIKLAFNALVLPMTIYIFIPYLYIHTVMIIYIIYILSDKHTVNPCDKAVAYASNDLNVPRGQVVGTDTEKFSFIDSNTLFRVFFIKYI